MKSLSCWVRSGVLAKVLAWMAMGCPPSALPADDHPGLRIVWENEMLTVRGAELAGGEVKIHYLEAFCRDGSTDRDWDATVIKHRTQLLTADPAGSALKLRNTLDDGVVVDHDIQAGRDEVSFKVVAANPTPIASRAHWAQPCIRVDRFTGRAQADYVERCFVVLDGTVVPLPTQPWATTARYTPGQVYCPPGVDRRDVNPRPLSTLVPSRGLIGCFSADGRQILATAWEPYQELFQGVIVCIHSDFRIGGLEPGEQKRIRGKLYLVTEPIGTLMARYERDFPEHLRQPANAQP